MGYGCMWRDSIALNGMREQCPRWVHPPFFPILILCVPTNPYIPGPHVHFPYLFLSTTSIGWRKMVKHSLKAYALVQCLEPNLFLFLVIMKEFEIITHKRNKRPNWDSLLGLLSSPPLSTCPLCSSITCTVLFGSLSFQLPQNNSIMVQGSSKWVLSWYVSYIYEKIIIADGINNVQIWNYLRIPLS